MTRVALFTKTFLEATHHAIAGVVRELDDYEFIVFAKQFQNVAEFDIATVRGLVRCGTEFTDDLRSSDCRWVHAVFDGDIALRAAATAQQLGLPAILSFHGGFDTKAKIHDPLYREITRQAAQNAARVTVVSQADAQRLRDIGVMRNIDVMRVPIDRRLLPPARRTPRRLVAIGRLVEKKGFDVALRALAELPDYELTIVGDGPLSDRLRGLADDLGVGNRVHWLGTQPLAQCLRILSESFALVHPAAIASDGNAEGTPQAVLWAQGIGIPVIVGDSGDLPEIVVDGETGLRRDPKDHRGFAAAAHALESEPFAESIIAAARRATAPHSVDAVIAQWRALYRDLEES